MENWVNCWNAKASRPLATPISSQAKGSGVVTPTCTLEGSETRDVNTASNKRPHECPASLWDGDMVRYPRETLGVGLNSPRNICRWRNLGFRLHDSRDGQRSSGPNGDPQNWGSCSVSCKMHRVNCGNPQHVTVVGIRSQATQSAKSSVEGSETRGMTSATYNCPHERPATLRNESRRYSPILRGNLEGAHKQPLSNSCKLAKPIPIPARQHFYAVVDLYNTGATSLMTTFLNAAANIGMREIKVLIDGIHTRDVL